MLVERKQRKTGSRRLGKHSYPRASFDYLAHNTDPSPDILVLGDWKNPTTKNKLIAGINLNYLSSGQLKKLRKTVDKIFRKKSLRARYRFVRDKLPDIAMYYRTYDANYIKSIERNELDSYVSKVKPSSKDEKVKTMANVDQVVHTKEPSGDVDQQTTQLNKDAWKLKRRLYDPEKERRRTSPERIGIAGSKAAKKAKNARYVRDRKKLKELERQVELAKELRKMDEIPPEEPKNDELEPDDTEYGPEYHLDDLGYESKLPTHNVLFEDKSSFGYIPEIGYVWDSPEAYINNHTPSRFRLLTEVKHNNALAIFDIISKRFIIDTATSHTEMLFDANWDYHHTVLFEIVNNELLVAFDCSEDDAKFAINAFKKHGAGKVLFESRHPKVLEEKKQFSVTAEPGLTIDKDELNKVLTSLHTRPWGDESKFNASRWTYHLIKVDDDYWDKTYRFEIRPKEGKPGGTDLSKGRYLYKEPAAKSEIKGREGFVYRGMSWDEWAKSLRTKQLSSTGMHNIGQEGLTFYGSADTAEHYANGFAPYSFKPSLSKPGVVIEISDALVSDHNDNPKIPAGEFAHEGSLPLSVITQKWKLLPIVVKSGYVDVKVDRNGRASEGSRRSPSVEHVAIGF